MTRKVLGRRWLWFMPVILFASSPAAGQEITGVDLFKLWNDCEPVFLVVENLDDSAEKNGLTKRRIQTMAESRFRAARIYTDNLAGALFHVRIQLLDHGEFHILVSFNTVVHRDWSFDHHAKTNYAQTWWTGSIGRSAGNSGFIMQNLSEHIDEFINEYLRVNANGCN